MPETDEYLLHFILETLATFSRDPDQSIGRDMVLIQY